MHQAKSRPETLCARTSDFTTSGCNAPKSPNTTWIAGERQMKRPTYTNVTLRDFLARILSPRLQLLYYFEDIGGCRREGNGALVKFDIAIRERLRVAAKNGKRDWFIVEQNAGGLIDLVNLKNGDRTELTRRCR